MGRSLARVYIHLVFATKNREPDIIDEFRDRFHAYSCRVMDGLGCPVNVINSEPDHVHVLFELGRSVALSDAVQQLKKSASIWFHELGGRFAEFQWQAGYGAFSVSRSKRSAVERYIRNQRDHHRTQDFGEELKDWLREYEVDYDDREPSS